MTRMADPVRPHDDPEDDEQRFEDEGRRSIFSALWFRAILVVVVLGVVAAVAVPYVLELANQPPPRSGAARSEAPPLRTPVAPPPAAPMTPPPPSPAPMERPPAAEKAPTAETPTAMPAPVPPEKSATADRPTRAQKPESTVAKEQAAARQVAASTGAASAPGGAYFVQVGAFKSPDSAKKLATRLRELKYNVEESAMSGTKSDRQPALAPGPGATSTPSDKYDVYVTGATPADINAKLGSKGLTSEPSAGGVIVKPSLPLREAVALSKDLAVDGLKVQVRRSSGGAAAPSTAGGGTIGGDAVYRVRVGPFDDRGAATSTLRELEQRGYTPFLARGGQ
jgi:cell division protein FtsN